VGTDLLNRLFDSLRAAGHESVWLAVMADNDVGRSFYDKHGFELHDERIVEIAEQEIDDVILVWDL
jgi:ribosomal protein S18 acetylase RimI-like enzyme